MRFCAKMETEEPHGAVRNRDAENPRTQMKDKAKALTTYDTVWPLVVVFAMKFFLIIMKSEPIFITTMPQQHEFFEMAAGVGLVMFCMSWGLATNTLWQWKSGFLHNRPIGVIAIWTTFFCAVAALLPGLWVELSRFSFILVAICFGITMFLTAAMLNDLLVKDAYPYWYAQKVLPPIAIGASFGIDITTGNHLAADLTLYLVAVIYLVISMAVWQMRLKECPEPA